MVLALVLELLLLLPWVKRSVDQMVSIYYLEDAKFICTYRWHCVVRHVEARILQLRRQLVQGNLKEAFLYIIP